MLTFSEDKWLTFDSLLYLKAGLFKKALIKGGTLISTKGGLVLENRSIA